MKAYGKWIGGIVSCLAAVAVTACGADVAQPDVGSETQAIAGQAAPVYPDKQIEYVVPYSAGAG